MAIHIALRGKVLFNFLQILIILLGNHAKAFFFLGILFEKNSCLLSKMRGGLGS
jgi:hypothetical protein